MSLPGIGRKSATRIMFYILDRREEANTLSEALHAITEDIGFCPRCFFFIEKEGECFICSSLERDSSVICVVENPTDLLAIEKGGAYRGMYHVLHGIFSPEKGIGESELHIETLKKRVEEDNINEIILATNPTMEGETTASYIANLFKDKDITITRIAAGIPVGSTMDFVDSVSIARALTYRRKY